MPVVPDPSDVPTKERSNSSSSSSSLPEEHQGQDKPIPNTKKGETLKEFLSKGPQIPDEMPPKISREEIEKRMEQLNKWPSS